MSLQVSLLSRDPLRGQAQPAPSGVRLRAVSHSWTAVGGPDRAELRAEGSEEALAELASWLRCPVTIARPEGLPVWWGYLEGVWVRKGQVEIGASLDGMANRVRVSYQPLPGGPRRFTAWLDDARSQRLYGVKELQARAAGTLRSLAGAESLAASLLAERAAPPSSLHRAGAAASPSRGKQGCEARLTARGWWHSLAWRAYSQPTGLEQNAAAASGSQGFGTPTAPMLRQSFVASAGAETWPADRVGLHLRKVGSPGDSVIVELRSALSGELLSTGQIAASSLSPGQGWVEVLLDPAAAVVPGMEYELRLRRSGSLDALNAYRVDHDLSANREEGSFAWWNGGSWVEVQPPASLLFKLAGTEDSLAQLRRMLLAGAGGQFLNGVESSASDGVSAGLWRDGQSSAREEVERMLAMGTSEGRRLLARIDEYRRAVIWKAPLPGERDYLLMSDGGVLDAFRRRILPGECPVGVWAHGADIVALAPGGQETSPPAVWIERATWDEERGRLELG
ncbi:MAG TPA: hypothetical protein VGJ97_05120 [Anaerolineaceae bacterium]